MATDFGQVHVKPSRGTLRVMAMGSTARGTRYIKNTEVLEVKNMEDPAFKSQLAAAVEKLYA